uniref:Uncharacterized protein n=1 Tax=Siphoviridae sp. ct4Uy2 TaxID=2827777 RepID=A0A8S5SKA7_9CAUD|nr:MAG TPA: hypothetical protein [Siphoviridae sp. ct4Uy2]
MLINVLIKPLIVCLLNYCLFLCIKMHIFEYAVI